MRYKNPVFGGEFIPVCSDLGHLVYLRRSENRELLVAVNRWCEPANVFIDRNYDQSAPLFGDASKQGVLTVPAEGFVILQRDFTLN